MAHTMNNKLAILPNEVEMILDFIDADDALNDLRASGVKGWLGTPEDKTRQDALHTLRRYQERTGRIVMAMAGQYAGNSWN